MTSVDLNFFLLHCFGFVHFSGNLWKINKSKNPPISWHLIFFFLYHPYPYLLSLSACIISSYLLKIMKGRFWALFLMVSPILSDILIAYETFQPVCCKWWLVLLYLTIFFLPVKYQTFHLCNLHRIGTSRLYWIFYIKFIHIPEIFFSQTDDNTLHLLAQFTPLPQNNQKR